MMIDVVAGGVIIVRRAVDILVTTATRTPQDHFDEAMLL